MRLIDIMFKNRGYTPEFIADISNGSHADLYRVDEVVQRLRALYDNGSRIVVLPDFDMDGIMSGVIGYAGLAELGFNVALFIPDPNEGYEFTAATIRRLYSQYPDVCTILTCDVGTSCYDGIDEAKRLGVDVIVTDHHNTLFDFEECMHADVVVNPMQPSDSYEHSYICGAFVLYQCLMKYAEMYAGPLMCDQMKRLSVFAGIGTISDMMPLLYENRCLVCDAIAFCRLLYGDGNSWFVDCMPGSVVYKRAFIGLYSVFRVFAEKSKIRDGSSIDENFFGFYLAPMFNSVKRLGGQMTDAFDVFFGFDAVGSANRLYDMNEKRKELVETSLSNIFSSEQPFAPYVYFSDAPAGLFGLLAAKLMELDGLPKLVLRQDPVKHSFRGSGRSPVWYPLFSRATANEFYIAGHEHAFGAGFRDIADIERFCSFLADDCKKCYDAVDTDTIKPFIPDFTIALDGSGDVGIDIPLFIEYISDVSKLAPFGQGFEKPCILLRFRAGDGVWSTLVSKKNSSKSHLKVELPYQFNVLCWNEGQMISRSDNPDELIEVTGHLELNEFRGDVSINFIADTFAV